MRHLLGILGSLCLVGGIGIFFWAPTAIQEILAASMVTAGAVFICGAAILGTMLQAWDGIEDQNIEIIGLLKKIANK